MDRDICLKDQKIIKEANVSWTKIDPLNAGDSSDSFQRASLVFHQNLCEILNVLFPRNFFSVPADGAFYNVKILARTNADVEAGCHLLLFDFYLLILILIFMAQIFAYISKLKLLKLRCLKRLMAC